MRNKHSILMIICCAAPIAALFALPYLGIGGGSLSFLAIILLCPLLHLLMMREAHDHHHSSGDISSQTMKPLDWGTRRGHLKEERTK